MSDHKKIHITLLFLILAGIMGAQDEKQPVARFSFNNMSDRDEISGQKARLKKISFTKDRFGNENYAAFLFGNEYSYINLGNYKALKPVSGSIAFWVKIENESWSGKGRVVNPFILTKNNSPGDDFYEAYSIGYYPETKKTIALSTLDSTNELSITSVNVFEINKWQHLALTYDSLHFSFYINGRLEQTFRKNFTTQFKASDSVIIGSTANQKNRRSLCASFDDLAFYDVVLNADDVKTLYEAPNPKKLKIILHWLLMALIILMIAVIFYFIIKYQATLKLKKEKEQLQLANKLLETELRVNRALMNPHFVFNSLNALQHFILQKEISRANNYLVKFSKLIRRILESNMANTTSLEMETDLITRYLEIEGLRFEENIMYSITVEPGIIASNIYIPVMMIQPFVENAIWHGLLKKPGEKILNILFTAVSKKYILCVIEDNGLGRNKEQADPEKKPLATAFVLQRLALLNKLHNLNCSLVIEDKPQGRGTTVKILLPTLSK